MTEQTTDNPAMEALRQREVQMLGAALSRRNWHDVETAYNQLRDKIDAMLMAERRARTILARYNSRRDEQGEGALKEIADMMGKHVTNWPNPKRLSTAIKLIDKTLAAAMAKDEPVTCPRATRLHSPLRYCPDCPGEGCELPADHRAQENNNVE
jgi:hypothetical protein